MKEIKLSPRLSAAAELAAGARRLIDVGTDHGYLPVYFAQKGDVDSITAADLRPGPLGRARRSAESFGAAQRINFVLADGLDFPGAELADTVVIAGMGGETVMDILSRAPWTRLGPRLIIQPQTRLRELCLWLGENGYGLADARLARDCGRLYLIMSVHGAAKGGPISPEELLSERGDPLLGDWLRHNIKYLGVALSGAERARCGADAEDIRAALARYRRLEEALK